MKAVLLSAGLGTRLRPLTDKIPKCMVTVNNKTMLQFWIEKVEEVGVKDILINTHYKADIVKKFVEDFSSQKGISITVSHEKHLLGTAGTLETNKEWLNDGEKFFCVHVDNYTDVNLYNMLCQHNSRTLGCLITLATFRTKSPESCGIIKVDDKGIVTKFVEKPSSPEGNLANGAIYVMEKEVVNMIAELPAGVKDISGDVLPLLINRMQSYEHNGHLIDIGTHKNLALARSLNL